MSIEVERPLDRIDVVSAYAQAVTGLRIFESEANRASEMLLKAWDEPSNPIFDPNNYDMGLNGKLPSNTLLAVPFTLALGGLTSTRVDLIDPDTIARVTASVQDNVETFRGMPEGIEERKATIRAAHTGLAIFEAFGALSFLGKNQEARKAIKKSNSFTRKELRRII